MKLIKTKFKDLMLIKTKNYFDNRGFFKEVYKKKIINKKFVFDCMSFSKKKVIRGLHIQTKKPQAKVITVVSGKIMDVAVDLRKNSKTFGKYFSIRLSEKNGKSVYLPEGFAHGFLGIKKENIIYYLCTNYRSIKHERGIKWNDKDLKIKWPTKNPIISKKDKNNIGFIEYKRKFID